MVLRAADEPETPLGEQMEKMKTEMKALRTALEAPNEARKDQYVKRAQNFHAAAVAARKFDPDKTKTLPEAERAGFVASYHKAMDKLIKNSKELENMLAAGNWEAANRQLKEMGREQKAGHKEFRVEKD
jgi:soluble cytochrome b562